MDTKIFKISRLDEEGIKSISSAAKIIKAGGLVVFPTETVYGLGADATSGEAAKKIYAAKGRPADNPLIIHVANPTDADLYAEVNELYFALAERFMPGPLTVVLPAKPTVPSEIRATLPTVAVRCPENKIANKLISLAGVPIAAPSANLSGSPSPTRACHVIDDMSGRVDAIIDGGDCEFGLESTIVKIDSPESLTILRPGKITREDLLTVCKNVKIASAVTEGLKEGEQVISPGMKYRHYAPSAPVYLLDAESERLMDFIENEAKKHKIAVICYDEDIDRIARIAPTAYVYKFGEQKDELTQARLLFDILRDTDKHSFDKIFAPLPRREGVGLALYNRMIRAAAYQIIRM